MAGGRGEARRRKRPADPGLSTMAAATASSALKRLDLRDANALFETHGAEEIRGLERQVRAEIEHKKEELRQMVGERYRDLIEAADTIGQMRRCAEGLVDAVQATDQYCARLRQAGSAAPRAPRAPQVSPGSEPAAPAARRTPPLTFRRRSPPLTPLCAPGRNLPAVLGTRVRCRKVSRPFAPGAFPDFRTIPSPPAGSLRSPSLLTENARGLSTVKHRSLPFDHTVLSKSVIPHPTLRPSLENWRRVASAARPSPILIGEQIPFRLV